jgi:hypothetical protein
MTKFFVGVDLGQSLDYTAVSIIERLKSEGAKKEYSYHVRHLERVRGVPYPKIVSSVARMVRSPGLQGDSSLVIDQTGCGRPVFDMFRAAGLDPVGVNIHGGDAATHDGRSWRVPKRDLVGVLQVLLQTGRLKVASKLELGPILQQEMLNFKVKIDPATAHDSYSAWREADHDDLVLAVALATWYAEQHHDTPICAPGASNDWTSRWAPMRDGFDLRVR